MDEKLRNVRDYFAELYVAGMLADAGWNIYFPHRDMGIDFIISKTVSSITVIRAVQVKGKYLSRNKTNKQAYGFVGKLKQRHLEMVLAIPYFSTSAKSSPPVCVAYMPFSQIRKQRSKGFACQPASFKNGAPEPRRDFRHFFDKVGIEALESEDWKDTAVQG